MPTPPLRTTGSKLSPVSTDRTVAQVRAPADTTGQAENKIEISTILTSAGPSVVLYNGDRMWAKLTVTLETAGPVVVGQQSGIVPVLSGKGQLLQSGVPTILNVAKGNRIYIAANGVNRVKLVIEAYPFLETITGLLGALASALRAPISAAASAAASAIARVTGKTG